MPTDRVLRWLNKNKNGISTPFYLYDQSSIENAVSEFRNLFPRNSRLYYSLKANPQPRLVRLMSSMNVGVELASSGEWHLAKIANANPSEMVFGGVAKSSEFLEKICNSNCCAVVIESEAEWKRVLRLNTKCNLTPVLLRINPGQCFSGLNMARGTQFGLDIQQAIGILKKNQRFDIDWIGLHFYFGSQRLDLVKIIESIKEIEKIVLEFHNYNLKIKVIDLGLGCGVPYLDKDKPLNMQLLQESLKPFWDREPLSSIQIWSEAGRALIGGSGYFIAKVTEIKELHGEKYIFIDGGLNVHNPGIGLGLFLRGNPKFNFICNQPDKDEKTVNIVGNLCTSADRLGLKVRAPLLKEGDLVVIPNSGAYCMITGLWGFNVQKLFSEGMLLKNNILEPLKPVYEYLWKI